MVKTSRHNSPLQDDTAAFRRFNRMYTQFLGTLNEPLMDSDYSLAEARVLYELAHGVSLTATAMAEQLGIDAGYLSRILTQFAGRALLKKKTSRQDSRRVELILTPKGRKEFAKLDGLSERQASDLFLRLPAEDRMELIRCLSAIERILKPPALPEKPYIFRPHRIGDMGWVVHSESVGYARAFGWDATFEALVAKIVGEFLANYDASRERCWIAERDGRHAGHVFLVKHPDQPDTAKLRLLFVEPHARNRGLGEALVSECIRFASTAGYRKVALWTQSMLTGAHRIYEKAGFRLVKEEPHYSFGLNLTGQEWELDLTRWQAK